MGMLAKAIANQDQMLAKMKAAQARMEAKLDSNQTSMAKFEGKMEEIMERQTKHLMVAM
jgi:hypothetical protein